MKKSIKAVIAMLLVLSLGFAMLSTTAFAASAASDVVPQSAGIRDFFSSLFKKIVDTIKSIFDKTPDPEPEPEPEPTQPTVVPSTPNSGLSDEDIVIIDDSYSGNGIGGSDQYAGGLW